MYTPEHTWTTLQDKTLSVKQIDRVCDLHFVYMGYGKFGHITHKTNDPVKTAEIQPSIRGITRKVVTNKTVERTAISRTRHGHHPQCTTSVHIDYCNLNKGQDLPKVKSPTKGRKRRSATELTLREPSANRIAAQSYIPPDTQHETLPGQIIGSAIKQEDVKKENKKEEQARYLAILGERRKRKTTASEDQMAVPKPTETILYTHAHGHTCSHPDCTPIIVSKRGVIKPSRPPTGHSHISNITCQRMLQDNAKSTNTTDAAIANLENIEENQRNVPNNELEQATKSANNNTENTTTATESVKDTDTTERDAARGLLMLQQLAEMDMPDNTDDTPLVPLVPNMIDDNNQTKNIMDIVPQPDTTHDDKSDDTVIYDPLDYHTMTNEANDTQEPPPPKGVLTIRDVGIKSTSTVTTDPVGPVTNEGKLRCNYCRRSFDTRTEKNLHIARRHADLAAETARRASNTDPNVKDNPKCMNIDKKSTDTSEGNARNKAEKPKPKPPVAKSINKKDRTASKERKKSDRTKSMNTAQKKSMTPATRTRKYRCQVCERVFDQQSELNRHFKKRHPPVQCDICKKSCATPNTLDRHMYKHKPQKHQCAHCDQSFAFKSELNGHLITHQGEPGFFCENCDKSFMRYQDLVAHEQTHTGVVHKCTIKGCNYSAKDNRYLKIHMKTTHASVDKYQYQCELCGQWFKFFEQRKRHYNTYH